MGGLTTFIVLGCFCTSAWANHRQQQERIRYQNDPRDYYFENDFRAPDPYESPGRQSYRDTANPQRVNWQQPFENRKKTWNDRYDFSGWYGDEEYDIDSDYYYNSEEYDEYDEYFDEDLDFVDKETIANNEEEIYRVRAELEYDEMRIERMSQKMKVLERNMSKMQSLINSKYPFGGYYKK